MCFIRPSLLLRACTSSVHRNVGGFRKCGPSISETSTAALSTHSFRAPTCIGNPDMNSETRMRHWIPTMATSSLWQPSMHLSSNVTTKVASRWRQAHRGASQWRQTHCEHMEGGLQFTSLARWQHVRNCGARSRRTSSPHTQEPHSGSNITRACEQHSEAGFGR